METLSSKNRILIAAGCLFSVVIGVSVIIIIMLLQKEEGKKKPASYTSQEMVKVKENLYLTYLEKYAQAEQQYTGKVITDNAVYFDGGQTEKGIWYARCITAYGGGGNPPFIMPSPDYSDLFLYFKSSETPKLGKFQRYASFKFAGVCKGKFLATNTWKGFKIVVEECEILD